MTKPTIRIHDLITNEVIDREMTDAEYKDYQDQLTVYEAREKDRLDKENEKLALLAKLGITLDEAKLLLS